MKDAVPTYGTINRPASIGEAAGKTYGVFYRGGARHIAPYVPYALPPGKTLCGSSAGAADRDIDNMCPECMASAKEVFAEIVFR